MPADSGRRIHKVTALIDSSGGTASSTNTIIDVPGTYTEADLANQLATLAATVNSLITELQEAGLMEVQ